MVTDLLGDAIRLLNIGFTLFSLAWSGDGENEPRKTALVQIGSRLVPSKANQTLEKLQCKVSLKRGYRVFCTLPLNLIDFNRVCLEVAMER